ncbi:MAG: hypothetical protein HY717_21910 [Planctomycetes bacterium]|nr:hypothetical protein [Planctomycetota bacterium]
MEPTGHELYRIRQDLLLEKAKTEARIAAANTNEKASSTQAVVDVWIYRCALICSMLQQETSNYDFINNNTSQILTVASDATRALQQFQERLKEHLVLQKSQTDAIDTLSDKIDETISSLMKSVGALQTLDYLSQASRFTSVFVKWDIDEFRDLLAIDFCGELMQAHQEDLMAISPDRDYRAGFVHYCVSVSKQLDNGTGRLRFEINDAGESIMASCLTNWLSVENQGGNWLSTLTVAGRLAECRSGQQTAWNALEKLENSFLDGKVILTKEESHRFSSIVKALRALPIHVLHDKFLDSLQTVSEVAILYHSEDGYDAVKGRALILLRNEPRLRVQLCAFLVKVARMDAMKHRAAGRCSLAISEFTKAISKEACENVEEIVQAFKAEVFESGLKEAKALIGKNTSPPVDLLSDLCQVDASVEGKKRLVDLIELSAKVQGAVLAVKTPEACIAVGQRLAALGDSAAWKECVGDARLAVTEEKSRDFVSFLKTAEARGVKELFDREEGASSSEGRAKRIQEMKASFLKKASEVMEGSNDLQTLKGAFSVLSQYDAAGSVDVLSRRLEGILRKAAEGQAWSLGDGAVKLFKDLCCRGDMASYCGQKYYGSFVSAYFELAVAFESSWSPRFVADGYKDRFHYIREIVQWKCDVVEDSQVLRALRGHLTEKDPDALEAYDIISLIRIGDKSLDGFKQTRSFLAFRRTFEALRIEEQYPILLTHKKGDNAKIDFYLASHDADIRRDYAKWEADVTNYYHIIDKPGDVTLNVNAPSAELAVKACIAGLMEFHGTRMRPAVEAIYGKGTRVEVERLKEKYSESAVKVYLRITVVDQFNDFKAGDSKYDERSVVIDMVGNRWKVAIDLTSGANY